MRLALCGLAPGMLILTGCIDWADYGDSNRYKEDFHFSYPLSPGGTVSIENSNGFVNISGWEQNTIEINGTKFASTKGLLDAVKIDTNSGPSSIRIRTIRPMDMHGGAGARYTIHVPHKVLLDSIQTTNGSIRVEEVTGPARLRTSNGPIHVSRLTGDLEARTTNGAIELNGVNGGANLHTSNGSIKGDAEHGTVEATTTNGPIDLTLTAPTANWPVKLHSTNGRIELRINGSKVPDVRADTTNSSITLHLPDSANARVRASTSHSKVESDFDGLMRGAGRTRSDLEGTIGTGGSLIELSSTNGSIRILKN